MDAEYTKYEAPANFTLGSMGGFYRYEEMLAILDDMVEKFPDIISVRKDISDLKTHEDRAIQYLVISDTPDSQDMQEPSVLYTSLHHARETNSLFQMFFYMWYLLENYESDAYIKQLIDETQLIFIPCVNPDGYIFNQTNEPNGGGFWRLNRRQNEDGTIGVDLNRNYGFEWGHDDIGSSPAPGTSTYRGPEPFSEPETQAVKFLAEQWEVFTDMKKCLLFSMIWWKNFRILFLYVKI